MGVETWIEFGGVPWFGLGWPCFVDNRKAVQYTSKVKPIKEESC
jgi:hypothetical protein